MPQFLEPGLLTLGFFGGPKHGEVVLTLEEAPAIAIRPEGCEDGFYVWHPVPNRYEWVHVPPLDQAWA